MADLTDNELRAVAYYGIGVSSEGGDVCYRLSYAGRTTQDNDGSVTLAPAGGSNSGYSIGTLQTDFGAHPKDASDLVDSFQLWTKTNHPDWSLTAEQQEHLSADLGRDGNHIRDKNFDADVETYHGKRNIPADLFPSGGLDIDQTFKAHLNAYLTTDAGITFIHQKDAIQVEKLMDKVARPLQEAHFYERSSLDDQAKIFAIVAKAYNQGERYGKEILKDIKDGNINSLEDVNNKIDGFRDHNGHPIEYMRTGRAAALSGAETFNALRNSSQANAMHEPWQAVVANPLITPSQLGADPRQPHLAEQYATVRGAFVDPAQGRAFVGALESGGSHNYGDPASANSRGFYVEGTDFLQWDKNGNGRAFVSGQWSEFSRNELALALNGDHTLDVNIHRNGETHSLLHVTHPTGHAHRLARGGHEVGALHQGMHGEPVQKLQAQLGELGYLDNTVAPDGKFGSATATAVRSFQHDHHLPEVGRAGPATRQAIQASLIPLIQHDSAPLSAAPSMYSLSATGGVDDPRNMLSPDHALYGELQQRIPDASEERLLQFTAACHSNKITADSLSTIHLDETNMKIGFHGTNFLSTPVTVDLTTPPPHPQQAIKQIRQRDQQQFQMLGQSQAQNAQVNQQQGSMAGGPQGPI